MKKWSLKSLGLLLSVCLSLGGGGAPAWGFYPYRLTPSTPEEGRLSLEQLKNENERSSESAPLNRQTSNTASPSFNTTSLINEAADTILAPSSAGDIRENRAQVMPNQASNTGSAVESTNNKLS